MIQSGQVHKEHKELLEVIAKEMPTDEKLFDLAELFKMFGDSTRMKILFVLFETEACTCGLAEALNMTSSAVSHQLGALKRAKLIKSRRAGKSVYYSLADDHVRTIIRMGMEHIEE
ncbi:MAG: helix-turn-helix transcriptional regulator [Oscillospiraceae bacterium]|nr:helix-turn-helix transcriptional regulator [Oscillospiraceae bacterium]MBQ4545010.1 helix-turn-helix transcriptional regulator [Oscillospiraceae bacterium]MBQ6902011.1 helix-turn-helix transcriptional regulator [Oscillospiraceae bacterium]